LFNAFQNAHFEASIQQPKPFNPLERVEPLLSPIRSLLPVHSVPKQTSGIPNQLTENFDENYDYSTDYESSKVRIQMTLTTLNNQFCYSSHKMLFS